MIVIHVLLYLVSMVDMSVVVVMMYMMVYFTSLRIHGFVDLPRYTRFTYYF